MANHSSNSTASFTCVLGLVPAVALITITIVMSLAFLTIGTLYVILLRKSAQVPVPDEEEAVPDAVEQTRRDLEGEDHGSGEGRTETELVGDIFVRSESRENRRRRARDFFRS
ncbi:uncharacterized protein RCC_08788 [Ramularia collo-cygni]|uniref:Uncharacterized protein n=1 Tax=Ramularia collo-cygni TaxID=112498 RepID=A0A2D3VN13_9PEZI|nr:uncharacterized protein RCC_08788 [Ramularia collo-cygni]CZT23078.1 uncharacterized protein RCC_08788 [Ramularia collo-cygni]